MVVAAWCMARYFGGGVAKKKIIIKRVLSLSNTVSSFIVPPHLPRLCERHPSDVADTFGKVDILPLRTTNRP